MSRESWLESQEELCDIIKGWCLLGTMVIRKGQGITDGGDKTPLSAIRPCRMELLLSEALDMNGSPHLTIGYLLRVGCGDLES